MAWQKVFDFFVNWKREALFYTVLLTVVFVVVFSPGPRDALSGQEQEEVALLSERLYKAYPGDLILVDQWYMVFEVKHEMLNQILVLRNGSGKKRMEVYLHGPYYEVKNWREVKQFLRRNDKEWKEAIAFFWK